MTKEEKIDSLKNKISMALKDTVLQIGFEVICKQIEDLKAYNEKLLNGDIEKHNKIVALEKACAKLNDKLTKAKEIFQEYIRINLLPPIERKFNDEVKLFKEAEQFLKE